MSDTLQTRLEQIPLLAFEEPIQDPHPVHSKQSWTTVCQHCGHTVLEACTDRGRPLLLDTARAVYIVVPRWTKDGQPICVPSRGYPVHKDHDL